MGENCIISTGCVIGNKGGKNAGKPIIGNNVEIAVGAKVIGKIKGGEQCNYCSLFCCHIRYTR